MGAQAATAIDMDYTMPGVLATASTDGTVKVWDVSSEKPKFACTKEMNVVCVPISIDAGCACDRIEGK